MARCGKGYQMTLSWVPTNGVGVPKGAICAGDGVYVGRAKHRGDVIPGSLVPADGMVYVSYGGNSHPKKTFEVLCATGFNTCPAFQWKKDQRGHTPRNALVGGVSEYGDPLYVARTVLDGKCVVGKVHNGHTCGYFPHEGKEVSEDKYEVLIWCRTPWNAVAD
ncbi:unnamed protein product [Dicrocoelium dendriticum]|nr:unnamed protein product [Dicrocoelium dendriticum]